MITPSVMNLGRWATLRTPFVADGITTFSGVSGGRTSGMMHAMSDETITPWFANTGREHPRTLEFISELEDATGRRVTWLEFRKPRRKGAPPREFRFEIVNVNTANRVGVPFAECFEALAEYRATKDCPPVSPWARQRLCTVYLKHRVADHWIESLGVKTYDKFVGLRRDEPSRVSAMKKEASKEGIEYRMPLDEIGVTKSDVGEFWSQQLFDLGLEDAQGNCTACFLKDQSDISRMLGQSETDAGWWLEVEKRFPRFGGQNFPGYAQLARETSARLAIEAALKEQKAVPDNDGSMGTKRYLNVVRQEAKRLKDGSTPFSCACEQSYTDDETQV